MTMIRLFCLLIISTIAYCAQYESMCITWDKYVTYLDKNKDFNNYKIATYDAKSGNLLVYYQGQILENNNNQMDISARSAAVWGPESDMWVADSFYIIKKTKKAYIRDDLSVEQKVGELIDASFDDNQVVASIRKGSPVLKIENK